eukprot:SAG11_NODE_20202_length_450_cov_1.592593_1_plen_33_part_10
MADPVHCPVRLRLSANPAMLRVGRTELADAIPL